MDLSLMLVVVGGLVLLVVLAAGIGSSLDTDAQRRAWRRVAEERRRLRLDLTDVLPETLCDRCPFRHGP